MNKERLTQEQLVAYRAKAIELRAEEQALENKLRVLKDEIRVLYSQVTPVAKYGNARVQMLDKVDFLYKFDRLDESVDAIRIVQYLMNEDEKNDI